MRSPTLNELPPPPPGKTGWPWTEATLPAPARMLDGRPWPRISILTPSYNQGQFIEETIRSVLLQGYEDLEFIIIDGGSSDQTIDVIKRYSIWLSYWTSEKDKGQSDALNKGLRFATGDIVAWVNTDDFYFPGVFNAVADAFAISERGRFWYMTAVNVIDLEDGRHEILKQVEHGHLVDLLPLDRYVHSAGVFWSRVIAQRAGDFDVDLHFGFDKEYWMRLIDLGYIGIVDNSVISAAYRLHPASKTVSANLYFRYEWAKIGLDYSKRAGVDETGVNQLKEQFIDTAIRLGCSASLSVKRRVMYLWECFLMNPSVLARRNWVSSVFRLLLGR